MALGPQPVSPRAGYGIAVFIAVLIAACLGAVLWRAEAGADFALGPAEWASIRFTVSQALISAVLSLVVAVPLARALARRQFPGRGLLITLLGAPFILPVIVAVLGLLAVFGRSGWLSVLLDAAGLPPVQIYGFHGVVLAHVFFNLPLATRLILQGWHEIPAERFRLAALLGMSARDVARQLEYPMLRQVVPGVFAVIFALCLTSFAVALTLGGGPRATTIELAIYQAFRFDFDLGKAAVLSCLQVLIAGFAAYFAIRWSRGAGMGGGLDRPVRRWDAASWALRVQDATLITLAALFLILPLLAVMLSGLPSLLSLPMQVYQAAGLSVLVAAASAVLLLLFALPMALAAAVAQRGMGLELAGMLSLAISPLVIGTGLFILLNPWLNPAHLALPLTAFVNAIMALPFALRILVPSVRETLRVYGRLGQSLDMGQGAFLRHVLLPRLRAQIGFSAGLGAALSMGDLGVIALFADPERATLPLQISRLMSAYRMEQAAGAGLLLLLLSLAAFWILDKGGRRHAAT